MLSTAIGIQFNVNDLGATYEVVGSSDNYSFQYRLGKGSDIVDFEGDAFQKSISLEGNYGSFDVRVFAVSDIGVRSAFVETGINISAPNFDNTFTFNNLRFTNLPSKLNVGSVDSYRPKFEGDELRVQSEYLNKEASISWELIPPVGHHKEGESLTSELLNDSFFDKFEIFIENGVDGNPISNSVLSSSASLQAVLSSSDVNDSLSNYRNFSIELNSGVFEDLNLERTFGVRVVSYDSLGRSATGSITGRNYESNIEGFSYNLRGSDVSFSWFSNDSDFKAVGISRLGIPSNIDLIDNSNLQANIDHFLDISSATPWNLGFGNYESGDMVSFGVEGIFKSKATHQSNANRSPSNLDFWESVGERVFPIFEYSEGVENSYLSSQVWGYSYYYALTPKDGFGNSPTLNLTEDGLFEGGNLFSLKSEVKIANLRYRERADDLIFNWDVIDQDGDLVDLDQYKFAMSTSDVPSILGISGSLFDSNTSGFLIGITQGNNSRISSVDEFGSRTIAFDLPNTKNIDSYEFTRELNNQIYGTGGFLSSFEPFDESKTYSLNSVVTDSNQTVQRVVSNSSSPGGITPSVKTSYDAWVNSSTYNSGDVVSYNEKLHKAVAPFGPESVAVRGVFDFNSNYDIGDLVVSANSEVFEYSASQLYKAGDFVLYNQTFYSCLRAHGEFSSYEPGSDRYRWKVLSLFVDVPCFIYKAKQQVSQGGSSPFSDFSSWEVQNPDNSEGFAVYIESFSLGGQDWSNLFNYNPGDIVFYGNDIWSGLLPSQGNVPVDGEGFWSNLDSNGLDIVPNYSQNDLVYHNGSVYEALSDNPTGGPINAVLDSGSLIHSDYIRSQWRPIWERDDSYLDFVYGHVGIPQSGKRSVGIEVGIIDNNGDVLQKERLIGVNQEPSIVPNGFGVDSLSEASKVRFNFNYAFSSQEKTSKVHLYRSSFPDFEITDNDGFPATGENSNLAKIILGAGDLTFGENITQITDSPPIPRVDGVDQITGYYYKILPFDDFGSGDVFGVLNNQTDLEKVIVYPKNYNNKNPNGLPGPVFSTSADDIPGPVVGFSGKTAFETYFLNWIHPSGEISSSNFNNNIPNDLSHYEVWLSYDPSGKLELGSLEGEGGQPLYLKDEASPGVAIDFSNNSGYRRIDGDIPNYVEGAAPIPIEKQDPASGITNATIAFSIDANSPVIGTSYTGLTDETSFFWVRPVDLAGNKGPFTGAAEIEDGYIEGLKLQLGQASATDISDFESRMTEKFINTISLIPNDPFTQIGGSNKIKWEGHDLYFRGSEYEILPTGETPDSSEGFVWWQTGKDYYNFSETHPAGSDGQGQLENFNDGDFIVSRVLNGVSTPVFHSFANATIGTANIANAAIESAKIKDLTADKITAGEIKGHELIIGAQGNQYGSVATPGFAGYTNDDGFTYPSTTQGFALSGDGTFEFKTEGGKFGLSEDGTLTLEGRLRQSDGRDFNILNINAIPSYVNYIEGDQGWELSSDLLISIQGSLMNSSARNIDLRFRMDVVHGAVSEEVFSYSQFNNSYNSSSQKFSLSGFSYDISDFKSEGDIKSFSASFLGGYDANEVGFHDIITANAVTGDAVVIYVSGFNSSIESSATIARLIDGTAGADGINGINGEPGNLGKSPTYRGEWVVGKLYQATASTLTQPGRGDVVKYSVGGEEWWICTQTNSSQSTNAPSLTSNLWKPFGADFESVATDLLLTQEAFITDKLTIGSASVPKAGVIQTPDFLGGILDATSSDKTQWSEIQNQTSSNYANPGFLLGRDNYGEVFFDVGGPMKGAPDTVRSFMRYSSSKSLIEINGAQFDGSINLSNVDIGNFDTFLNKNNLSCFIGAGYNNSFSNRTSIAASSIVSGGGNTIGIYGDFSIIGAGYGNELRSPFSAIAAGYSNKIYKNYGSNSGANAIGAGQFNEIDGGSNQSILAGSHNYIVYSPRLRLVYGLMLNVVISDETYLLGSFFGGPGEEVDKNKIYNIGDIVYDSFDENYIQVFTDSSQRTQRRNILYVKVAGPVVSMEGFSRTSRTGETQYFKLAFLHFGNNVPSPWAPYAALVNSSGSSSNWMVDAWFGDSCYVAGEQASTSSGLDPVSRIKFTPISKQLGWVYFVDFLYAGTPNFWGFVAISEVENRQNSSFWFHSAGILVWKPDNTSNVSGQYVTASGWIWVSMDTVEWHKLNSTKRPVVGSQQWMYVNDFRTSQPWVRVTST